MPSTGDSTATSYTQYGPFPYVLYEGLHLLGMPLTHTAGRILTADRVESAATLAAGLVWRVTRHSACMLAVLSAMFVYLWVMISEPSHPGGLIVLTTAIMGSSATAGSPRAGGAPGPGWPEWAVRSCC